MTMQSRIGKNLRMFLLTTMLLPRLVWSMEQEGAPPEKISATFSRTYPLTKFMTTPGPLELRHSEAQHTLFLPLAKRMRVKSAVLHLEFTNSTALLEQRSQLRVRLNEQVIAQTPLRPRQPEATLDIRLPVNLLKADYNRLQFQVAQHYTLECEDPTAPELWTQIDPTASTISLETELTPLTPRLSELEDLFDRKQWETPQLSILTGAADLRDIHLHWGSLVAQGVALRQEYVPLHLTHATAQRQEQDAEARQAYSFPLLAQASLAGNDAVLIGTKDELASYLSPAMLEEITNSYLAVHRLDVDPTHLLLVISGRDEAEVTRAAAAFAFLKFPFPDNASMRITEIQLPTLPDYTTKQSVRENGEYPFSSLGFQTATMKGVSAEPLRLEVVLPPDLFAPEDSVVELRLHLAYGAGLRADSVLNVMLNDNFAAVVALDQASGAAYRDYKLALPLRSFQPGRNVFTFSSQMTPSHAGECVPFQEENLLLTLFADSALTLPSASHFVRLPDFQLLAKTAFPYTVRPDGSTTAFHITDHDSNTIASAWMMAGKFAQKIGVPLHHTALSFQPPRDAKNLVVVGKTDTLDDQYMAAAPLSLGQEQRVPYPTLPVLSQQRPSFFSRAWLSAFVARLAHAENPPIAQSTNAQFLQVSPLGRTTVAMMMESPLHARKTVFLITAADSAQLHGGVRRLLTPEFWENLRGDVAIWRDVPETLTWQQAGADYYVGEVSMKTQMEYRFSSSPWVWVSAVLALLGAFALLTRVLLRRFARRHHGDVVVTESSE